MAHFVMMHHTKGVHPSLLIPTGFSWTTLFFGFAIPIVRGDNKWAVRMFVACLCTAGISILIFPFIYNGIFKKDLIDEGWYTVEYVNEYD